VGGGGGFWAWVENPRFLKKLGFLRGGCWGYTQGNKCEVWDLFPFVWKGYQGGGGGVVDSVVNPQVP